MPSIRNWREEEHGKGKRRKIKTADTTRSINEVELAVTSLATQILTLIRLLTFLEWLGVTLNMGIIWIRRRGVTLIPLRKSSEGRR